MKKLILSAGLFMLVVSISVIVFAQGQEKGKQKKEQVPVRDDKAKKDQGHGKGQGQGQGQGKGQGNDKNVVKDDKDNQGKKDDDAKVKADKDKGRGRDDVQKVVALNGNDKMYNWDRETFKDRKKFRNEGKVTICHKFNRTNEPGVAITVSRNALKAHLGHGDIEGPCPAYNGSYSDIFLGKRKDYYNTLYGAQEQVVYSQSILDYALQRLTGARSQLVTLQNNNAPVYEIERRQAVVTELEDNVSLLEVALGAVAGILVAKLAN
jgi:hypothetical protein